MSAVASGHTRRGQRGITLIELLVSMTIMGVLSTMIIATWFVLQSSASSASQQNIQRDDARQALSRIATEVRDAESRLGYAPVQAASANAIAVNTTFNNTGNSDQSTLPHLVRFRYDAAMKTVYRVEDSDDDGVLTDETERVLLRNVVNGQVQDIDEDGNLSPIPVFTYAYYTDSGQLKTTANPAAKGISTLRIITVQIRLLVDVKPNSSPTFMDLATSVQPRNLRN